MFLFWVKHLHTYSNIVINFQVKELREKRNRLSFIKYVYVNNHPFKSLMSTLFLNPITLKDRNYSNSLNTANNHCRFWDALGVVAPQLSLVDVSVEVGPCRLLLPHHLTLRQQQTVFQNFHTVRGPASLPVLMLSPLSGIGCWLFIRHLANSTLNF